MTIAVEDQACGNCYFRRTHTYARGPNAPAGEAATRVAVLCACRAPDVGAANATARMPWPEVHDAAWCGDWSDGPRLVAVGPKGDTGAQGPEGPQGPAGPQGDPALPP